MYDPAHARYRTVQPIGGNFKPDLTLKTCLIVHQHFPHRKKLVTWLNHFITVTYLKHLMGLVWNQPPVQWLYGAFLPVVKRPSLQLITRLRLVPSVRIIRGSPPGSPFAFLACGVVTLCTCRVSPGFPAVPFSSRVYIR